METLMESFLVLRLQVLSDDLQMRILQFETFDFRKIESN